VSVASNALFVVVHRVETGRQVLPFLEMAVVVFVFELSADDAGLFSIPLADRDGNYIIRLADALLVRGGSDAV